MDLVVSNSDTFTLIHPRTYRATVWERLLVDFDEKPPVPEDFGLASSSDFTTIGFSPDYSDIELRVLSSLIYGEGPSFISMDPSPSTGWEGWPWPRNRRERRAMKVLEKDLWEVVADAEDEVGERCLTKDPGEWNSKFWDFILRPKVPRCTKERAPSETRESR